MLLLLMDMIPTYKLCHALRNNNNGDDKDHILYILYIIYAKAIATNVM